MLGYGSGGGAECIPGLYPKDQSGKCVSWAILGMAIGKGLGAFVFFWNQWGS